MSVQVAVRLPDEVAEFVDSEVAAGRAASRTALITYALEQERRRREALADIAILKRVSPDLDLDDFVAYTAAHPVELD